MTQADGPGAVEEFGSLIFSVLSFRLYATAVRLGIPEALADGARPVAELATATGADERALRRLLRALAGQRLLTADGADGYALTATGRQLLPGVPGSARDLIRFYGDPLTWQTFGALEQTVRTGRTAFTEVTGTPFFEYFGKDPEYAQHYHAAMHSGSEMLAPLIVHGYHWAGASRLVDVGGGDGTTLAAVLAANPALRGTVYDTAEALRDTPKLLAEAGVADRVDCVPGDFLTSVPAGGDLYLLKNVLHEWDDESCVRILRSCREAVDAGGKVVVVASLLPDAGEEMDPAAAMYAVVSDVQLLCLTAGERSRSEYAALFERAGLRLAEVAPLPFVPNYNVLVAEPA